METIETVGSLRLAAVGKKGKNMHSDKNIFEYILTGRLEVVHQSERQNST